MENKLRQLLIQAEEDSSFDGFSDESFVSIDESMALQIRANYGGLLPNGTCSNNNQCSGNTSCKGNDVCNDNGAC